MLGSDEDVRHKFSQMKMLAGLDKLELGSDEDVSWARQDSARFRFIERDIHIYIYMYIHMHACIYIYIYTHVFNSLSLSIYIYIYINVTRN